MRSLAAFLATVFLLGIGANGIAVFAFGHLSSDAGGSALAELAMILVSWTVLAILSGIAFLAIATPFLPAMNHRWCVALASLLGGAAVYVAGTGLLGRFERWMWPEGGRIAWLAAASIPGAIAAIVLVSASLLALAPTSRSGSARGA